MLTGKFLWRQRSSTLKSTFTKY